MFGEDGGAEVVVGEVVQKVRANFFAFEAGYFGEDDGYNSGDRGSG